MSNQAGRVEYLCSPVIGISEIKKNQESSVSSIYKQLQSLFDTLAG